MLAPATGRHQNLSPGSLRLSQAMSGHILAQLWVEDLQVPTPTTAEPIGPALGHLHQGQLRNGGQHLPGGVVDPAPAPQIAGVMIGGTPGKGSYHQRPFSHKLSQELRGVDHLKAQVSQFLRVNLRPHVIAGGAGEGHPLGAERTHHLQVVRHQLPGLIPLPIDDQGVAAAPFLSAQQGVPPPRPLQHPDESAGDGVRLREGGGHTADEVDQLRPRTMASTPARYIAPDSRRRDGLSRC